MLIEFTSKLSIHITSDPRNTPPSTCPLRLVLWSYSVLVIVMNRNRHTLDLRSLSSKDCK